MFHFVVYKFQHSFFDLNYLKIFSNWTRISKRTRKSTKLFAKVNLLIHNWIVYVVQDYCNYRSEIIGGDEGDEGEDSDEEGEESGEKAAGMYTYLWNTSASLQ